MMFQPPQWTMPWMYKWLLSKSEKAWIESAMERGEAYICLEKLWRFGPIRVLIPFTFHRWDQASGAEDRDSA
jgi:hypothetical protein